MSTVVVDREGKPTEDMTRSLVAAAKRAFGLTLDLERLSAKEQMTFVRMWMDNVRTEGDGFALGALSKRQRKRFEQLLSRAAGRNDGVSVFAAAAKAEEDKRRMQEMVARLNRADRTKKEARGFQSGLLVMLSQFINQPGGSALTTGALGLLVLVVACLESGDVSGVAYGARIESGAVVIHDDYGLGGRAFLGNEPFVKSLRILETAELLVSERTGNRETRIGKGRLLLALRMRRGAAMRRRDISRPGGRRMRARSGSGNGASSSSGTRRSVRSATDTSRP